MLKIWGRVNSVNVKKALWCVEELGLKYDRVDAGMQFGVVDTPEYRRMNPNGLVPTIEDNGFILWESHSIVRYLAAKYGAGTLWRVDPETRADADRWMDWTHGFAREFQRRVFWPLVRTPSEQRDPAAIEQARRRCADLLGRLDAALADKHYLAGAFSMGDIPIGCHIQLWMRLPIERPRHPHLEAWFERLCERPAYQRIVDIPLS